MMESESVFGRSSRESFGANVWRWGSVAPSQISIALLFTLMATGCSTVPLKEGGTLTSYSDLGTAKGTLSTRRLYIDGPHMADVETVRIVPTTFSAGAASRVTSEADRTLVANAMDRALCVALSDRYQMVSADMPADLTLRSVVTEIVPTNKTAAGVATAVTFGTGFVLPVGVPRLPFGLGGLAVEAEAVDGAGRQRAALLWARGANSIQDSSRVSEVGDAYGLATKFAGDFSAMLISGEEPKAVDVSLPSRHRVQSWLGGEPKHAACEAFGRAPGLMGAVASNFGAPPEWTDGGPTPPSNQ